MKCVKSHRLLNRGSPNKLSVLSFCAPPAPFSFLLIPLELHCTHPQRQKFCGEMHPHRCLYLETHMVRFRRPISTVSVHVIQKKIYPQGDIHNPSFHIETKWNPKFTEFRLALYKIKCSQSNAILLWAPHSITEISASYTYWFLQVTQKKTSLPQALNTFVYRKLPQTALAQTISLLYRDLYSSSSARHTSDTLITIVWMDT